MSIVICSPQLGISPDTNSGGEVYDREVLKHLAKMGLKVEIILPKKRKYEKGIVNWSITLLPIKTIFPPYIFNLFLIPYLFKVFKKSKFKILRVHNPYFVGLAAVIFKFFKKVPIVASYLHLEDKNPIFSLINYLIIDKFDHVITISQSSKKEIAQKYNISKDKISVTYPGVDQKFKPKPKDKELLKKYGLEEKKILLYFGGLKFRKNISFLLDLIKEVNSDTSLLVCGEGNAKLFLKLKAALIGVSEKVKFTGYVKESEKVDFYNLCDIFLVPSKKEGFGMISTEAQACGKPVLVSNLASLPETVNHGKTGFVCKDSDLKDWVEKLELLLSNDDLRLSMSKNAQRFVKSRFSWGKTAKIQKEIFERIATLYV